MHPQNPDSLRIELTFQRFEDAISAYVQARQNTTQALFIEGDIAVGAVRLAQDRAQAHGQPQPPVEDVLTEVASAVGVGRTTIYDRWLTARVFPPGAENPAVYWSQHLICAREWTADDPDAPFYWLGRCAEGGWTVARLKHEIEDAKRRGATVEDLLDEWESGAIAREPVYLLDAAEVTIRMSGPGEIVLAGDIHLVDVNGRPVRLGEHGRAVATVVFYPDPDPAHEPHDSCTLPENQIFTE